MKITCSDIEKSIAKGIINMVSDMEDLKDTIVEIGCDAGISAEETYIKVSDKLWDRFGIIL